MMPTNPATHVRCNRVVFTLEGHHFDHRYFFVDSLGKGYHNTVDLCNTFSPCIYQIEVPVVVSVMASCRQVIPYFVLFCRKRYRLNMHYSFIVYHRY
jgi:hypothetical protein